MKINVTPEWRPDMYIPNKQSLIEFIRESEQAEIHCMIWVAMMMVWADWHKDSLIKEIEKSERIGILLWNAKKNNLWHALAVITNNELKMFDLSIDKLDLEILSVPK